ncbi:MAG TPA: DNA polymerase III subunit beta [Pirellulaceae bacterium]|nr:DNA polymerase III subunit beta [Pirellulaceae bacterium]HMO91348.1 DNA polymerase III subunit beta [Pirellulaceae bacterium]HMP70260.1 DNA polymerase III subunit beta [Pirellulaceae bacterium]
MKIKFARESLLSVYQIAAAVAPQRSPKTILQNVLLCANDDGLEIMATDMDLGVRLNVANVEIFNPGRVVVSVSRMGMILKESNDEFMTLESADRQVVITGNHVRFELDSQNPDEFPETIKFDEKDYFEIDSKVFKELIHRTLFATDTDSGRFALGGILLEFAEDTVTAVGTDGRRLAKMDGPIQVVGKPNTGNSDVIVPTRSMQMIERILAGDDGSVKLSPRTNDLVLSFSHGYLFSRLLEGRFPKWRDVLPNRTDSIKIDLQVGPMYSAIRQAAIVASDESRGINLTFNDGTLVLSSRTAEIGKSRVEMPIAYDKAEMTVSLDHRYFADFLKVLQPERSFTFDVEDEESAAYCQTDDSYGYVIMPLSRD